MILILLSLILINSSLRAGTIDTISSKPYIPPIEYKLRGSDFILPAALITVGTIFSTTEYKDIFSIKRGDKYYEKTYFDDVLCAAVPASLFLFDMLGEEKNHFVDQALLMGGSMAIAAVPVYLLKEYYDSPRPTGGKLNSFPSGHTAIAFVGAHTIYKEFRETNPWIAYSGYLLATGVGAARMYHNRHWFCDVLAGAGIGILSTELAYLIYTPLRNLVTEKWNRSRNDNISLQPTVFRDAVGVNLSLKF
ncbi:phosphatase PAP2 family protein [Bacteroidales bacterium OttesenSCG-928-I14]|nr:phosphatase PAP2 family protein [Bacteroidales bacterium OttesenSCG-928-I14]